MGQREIVIQGAREHNLKGVDLRLPRGALIVCEVPHCDPTVNLYDHYHCVRGDVLVDLWPVDARGRAG